MRTRRFIRVGRALARGVTLVEVLIVVAIMALVAGGVGFYVIPKYREAQLKEAKTRALTIRQVATQWIVLKGADECPTVQSLILDKQLDASGGSTDPWGQPYAIACQGDEVIVSSTGPDKKPQTEDDIVVGLAPAPGK
jgi:general secretion pathway protein G